MATTPDPSKADEGSRAGAGKTDYIIGQKAVRQGEQIQRVTVSRRMNWATKAAEMIYAVYI